MEEKEKQENLEKKEKENSSEQKLPYCTTAPSAEHVRAKEEGEPCDDFRSGNVGED